MANSVRYRTLLWQTMAWTVLLELITVILRFGFALESTRDTASTVGRLTFGLRIHHSYIGIALLPVAMWLERRSPTWSTAVLALGLGLFFSDMIHHFLVLWIVTGSPQFDLVY